MVTRHLRLRRALPLMVALSVALRPAPGLGQTRYLVAGHLGSSAAAPGGTMVDFAGEVQQGLFGVRLGVGMDAAGTPIGSVVSAGERTSGVWSSDADIGLNVGRIPYTELLFGPTEPTVFLAAGVAGISSTDATTGDRRSSVVPTWAYGARGTLPLATWLGVEVEARHRTTFGDVSVSEYPAREGWEYRAGLALRFGGRAAPRPLPAPRGGSDRVGSTRGPAGADDVVRGESAEEIAARTIGTAERYIGTRYRWGGDSPAEGFDCSGFVQYVFRQQGIELPRVSRDQARAGRALETGLSGLARGDLLFFAQGGPTVDHVAIYAGDGRIIHSSSSGRGVRYDDLNSSRGRYYVDHLVAVRRVIGGEMIMARELAAPSDADLPDARRAMPLDDAFEALLAERDDEAPPPER